MEGNMMIAPIKLKLASFLFFFRNINAARQIIEIRRQAFGEFIFRGYTELDADAIAEIYRQLNGGAVFSRVQRKLYRHIGKRCLFVVEQKDTLGSSKIVAMNMYYLNRRDVRENTIHEGFIGVLPEAGGKGIATKMRQMAVEQFRSSGFSGISTRISLDNSASIISAKKIGFQPVEEYQESSTGKQRYYMICKF